MSVRFEGLGLPHLGPWLPCRQEGPPPAFGLRGGRIRDTPESLPALNKP